MRTFEFPISAEVLAHGMAWDVPPPKNVGALSICSGVLPDASGLIGWKPIVNLAEWPETPAWPFPQLFKGKRFYILAYDDAIYRFSPDAIPYDAATWLLAKCSLRLPTDATLPFTLGASNVPWKFVDLGEAWLLIRPDVTLLYFPMQHLFGSTDPLGHTADYVWVCVAPSINAGCFCNGRVILGGFDKTNIFSAASWIDVFNEYYPECRETFNTILSQLLDMDENFVYWSSIGAADMLFLFFPQLATSGFLNVYNGTVTNSAFLESMRLGQWGQAPMDWDGAVRAIKPFGDQGAFIVYGDGGVTLMEPFLEPAIGFSKRELLDGIGIHSSGAVAGTRQEHVFLANTGDFYRIDSTGVHRIPCNAVLPYILYAAHSGGGGGGTSIGATGTWNHALWSASFNLRLHEYGNWLDFDDPPGCYVGKNSVPESYYEDGDPFYHSPSATIAEAHKYAENAEVAPTGESFEIRTGVYVQVDNAWEACVIITSSYRIATTAAGLDAASWTGVVTKGAPGYIGGSLDGSIDEFFNWLYKLSVLTFSGYWIQFKWTVSASIDNASGSTSVLSHALHLAGDLPVEGNPDPEEPEPAPVVVPDAPVLTGSISSANYILISRDPLYNRYYITWKNTQTLATVAYVLYKDSLTMCNLQEDLVTVDRHRGGLIGVFSDYSTYRYTVSMKTFPIDFGSRNWKTLTGIEVKMSHIDINGVDKTPAGEVLFAEITAYDGLGDRTIVSRLMDTTNRGILHCCIAGVEFVIKIVIYDPTAYTGDLNESAIHISGILLRYQSDDKRVASGFNPTNAS